MIITKMTSFFLLTMPHKNNSYITAILQSHLGSFFQIENDIFLLG
jgi:hypothetical protein